MTNLGLTDTLAIVASQAKDSAIYSSKIEVGNIVVDRAVSILSKKAPMMLRGYVDTPLGRAAIANTLASLLVNFATNNDKAAFASECCIAYGADVVIKSFNVPAMVNDLLDDIEVPSFAKETSTEK